MKVTDFKKMKNRNQKISMVTCYDAWSAKIIAKSNVDCILVGDSLAMVSHGHETTLPATVELMALHIAAVARGAGRKFIVGDMPFLSNRKGLLACMEAVQQLMQAGAHAIKLEGVDGNEELIRHIVESGVPVMGHIGLTPQSIHHLGGFKVQGKKNEAAEILEDQAVRLERAGCFAIVLECVPAKLATQITQALTIPTIGIGAGVGTNGQVLVLQDLLGMNEHFKPKFLKTYLDGFSLVKDALNYFDNEVKQAVFPGEKHAYSMEEEHVGSV